MAKKKGLFDGNFFENGTGTEEWINRQRALRQSANSISNQLKQEDIAKQDPNEKRDSRGFAEKALGLGKEYIVDPVVNAAKDSYTGIRDTAQGVAANESVKRKIALQNENLKEWNAYTSKLPVGGKEWQDPKVKEKLKEFAYKSKLLEGEKIDPEDIPANVAKLDAAVKTSMATNSRMVIDPKSGKVNLTSTATDPYQKYREGAVSERSKKDLEEAQKVDVRKTATGAAETFINAATLGVGTGLKAAGGAVVRGGFKVAAEQGAKAVAKQAAKEAAEAAIGSTGRQLAGHVAKDAAIGGAYGVTGAARNEDSDFGDYAKSIAIGAGFGGAIPVAGAGVKSGFSKMRGGTPGKTPPKLSDEAAADFNATMNHAIDEQSGKYSNGKLARVKQWVESSIINPYAEAAKLDDAYARANGIKRNKVAPEESVEDLLRRSAASDGKAEDLFRQKLSTGQSLQDLVVKYGEGKPASKEFNNYTNAKFLQEIRSTKKNYMLPAGQTDETIDAFIKSYEAGNPDALADLGTKKAANDMALDLLVEAKVFTADVAEHIKTKYKFAVPLEKVFPDDLARVEVGGKNLGSISKQTVIQALENGSDIPFSNSFDSSLNRIATAVRQSNRAKVAQKLLERQQQGLMPEAKMVTDVGVKEAKQAARAESREMSKSLRKLNKSVVVSNRQLRRVASELKKLGKDLGKSETKEARVKTTIDNVKPLMKENAPKTLDDFENSYLIKDQLLKAYGYGGIKQGAKSAKNEKQFSVQQMAADIENGGYKQLMEMNPDISESTAKSIASQVLKKPSAVPGKAVLGNGKVTTNAMLKQLLNSSEAEIRAIQKKIAGREPKLAMKFDEILDQKGKIEAVKLARQDLRETTAQLLDDPSTGKQVVGGIINGETYKMEVPPKIGKMLQGMDEQKLPSAMKVASVVKKLYEITWTGVLNPTFSIISFVAYDVPMSIIASPQGFKTFAPRAIKEGFKSVWGGTEFQQALRSQGVRPQGGSLSIATGRIDAKGLAMQGDVLHRAGYALSHPDRLLNRIDVFGGKLAGITRTRIARAAFDDAKKAGMNHEQAMQHAALAYRTVMPDYETIGSLTRQVNTFIPFASASVAGTRAFGQALKRDPVGTSMKTLAVGFAPMVGATAFSLMSPQGQEFYDDMEAAGKERTLSDNLILLWPGAKKDDKTGEWSGVTKIPLAPEFRAMNQTIYKEVRAAMNKGEGASPGQVALSLFDTVTGGLRGGQNPMIDTVKILAGQDPRTGEQLIKGSNSYLPKEEQTYDTTSGAGKWLGNFIGTSPIQADKVIDQFGMFGNAIQKGDGPITATNKTLDSRFTGAFGERAADKFYDSYNPAMNARKKASDNVTDLVKAGREHEAKRRAEEYNATVKSRFVDLYGDYGDSEAFDPEWHKKIDSLIISTTGEAFKARRRSD